MFIWISEQHNDIDGVEIVDKEDISVKGEENNVKGADMSSVKSYHRDMADVTRRG